jgi:predicted transcriptional regulator
MASIQPDSYSSPEERRERRAEMARALARGGMEGVHVISLEQAEEVLTPRRTEIIDALSYGEYESVRGLARALHRDKGQVSRDLGLLAEHGIVTFDTDGRSKSPRLAQEHVVIEPVV